MLAAVLPGFRDLRNPLVVGLLWAACVWLLFGPRLAHSSSVARFVRQYDLASLPPSAVLAGAAFAAYLIGSLLIVRQSPFRVITKRIGAWVERMDTEQDLKGMTLLGDNPREPRTLGERVFLVLWTLPIVGGGMARASDLSMSAIDGWLWDKFETLSQQEQIPNVEPGNEFGAVSKFVGFSDIEEWHSEHSGEGTRAQWDETERDFIRGVKQERNAVEVRVQVNFPDLYAEIDRHRSEGELRTSIFWPLSLLLVLASFYFSWWLLLLLVVPILLLQQGYQRISTADEKTWSVVVSGDVSTPVLDAVAAAQKVNEQDRRDQFAASTADEDAADQDAGPHTAGVDFSRPHS